MGKVKHLLGFIDTVNEWAGRIFGFLVIFMIAVILWEVIARYGFSSPTIWAHEISAFLFGAFIMFGAGYTLLHGEHVNMDIIYNRLPARMRASADVITSILFFCFALVLVGKGADMAWTSLRLRETSPSFFSPPIYPIKLTIPIAGSLLLLQGLAKFIRDLATTIGSRRRA